MRLSVVVGVEEGEGEEGKRGRGEEGKRKSHVTGLGGVEGGDLSDSEGRPYAVMKD